MNHRISRRVLECACPLTLSTPSTAAMDFRTSKRWRADAAPDRFMIPMHDFGIEEAFQDLERFYSAFNNPAGAACTSSAKSAGMGMARIRPLASRVTQTAVSRPRATSTGGSAFSLRNRIW